jgi:hypothetical protein
LPEPFQQQELVFGVQGLDLKRSLDLIPPTKLSRMNNVVRPEEGSLTGRAGQTTQFNTGSDLSTHHSIGRLNNRFQGTFTYLLGAGTSVYAGTTGTLTQVATGFSGNPLSLAAYHPPVSGDSWMYIGDSTKMGKVRGSDSLFTTIGLKPGISKDNRFRIDEFKAKPSGTIGGRDRTRFTCFGFDVSGAGPGTAGNFTAYAAQSKTTIDTCDTAGWTNNAGTGGSPTNVVDGAVFKQGTASLKLTTNPGGAAYYNFFNKANPLNLNTLGTGGTPATDDDIIHLWIRTDRPDILLEARVYFVLNSAFDLNTLPGISATLNTEAYMKIFRPSDFTPQFETSTGTLSQAGTVNTNFDALTGLPIITDTRASVMPIAQQFDQSKSASLQIGPGRGAWTEFGVIGLPIHRRDFRRLGTDTTRNWANVTGMVLAVQVTTNTAINVWFDDIYLTGGAGLDSSLLGLQPYDYRYRNFDPRTGAVSNPSPVQGIGFRLDSLRQGIVLTPSMYGDPAIRQQFFRRGGSINSQWLLAGVNTSDGGTFTDTQSDAAISASIALTFDNDQPVTTVDASGNALLAQPLPAIFGPVMDLLYGCGDPHRAGDLYWCKPTMLDSWPFSFHVEVCTPSEELMNGFAWGGQPYVFSRERLFAIYPNLSNAGQVSTQPTGCTHGLAGRWAFAVGAGGVYFAAKDGIYQVQGGPEVSISDQDVRGLFHGETRNGYLSVDFSHPEALRMAIFDNELWFSYRDTSGVNRTLIYSVLFQFWRFNQFGSEVASFYTEEGTSLSLLMGGRATGKTYQYSGTTDDGAAITSSYRTGALNQGDPRSNKLYGDISLDADVKGNTISVTPFLNNELTSLAPLTIATGVGRQRYYLDLAATVARNISFDFSWTTSSTPPNIWQGGPSYTLQPHTIETRVTNWDNQGQLGAKLVKGIKLEINTFGVAKTYNVQADGATATTFTVNTPDRRVQEFAWPQFTGRTLRIQPADAVDAMLYDLRWLFDEEPQFLTRWETQELGHGIDGWQFPVYGHITTRSTAPVFLTITAFRQDGTSLPVTYTIPSTAGAKIKQYVQFQMQKGILFKYLFTSDVQPFYLYKEESEVWVQPWGGQEARVVHNFGDDDLDQGRQMRDASLVAARSNYGF